MATDLQLHEEPLQLEGDALGALVSVVAFELPCVEGVPELWGHEEGLEEAVEVAGHGLVDQAHESWGEGGGGGREGGREERRDIGKR